MTDLTTDDERDALFEDLGHRLYLEAQIDIPPDIRRGLRDAMGRESNVLARGMFATMLKAIDIAERKHTLVCQDTGIPIFWITIGRGIVIDGARMLDGLRRGVERATRETPLRSSIVSPLGRENRHNATLETCSLQSPTLQIAIVRSSQQQRLHPAEARGAGHHELGYAVMSLERAGDDGPVRRSGTLVRADAPDAHARSLWRAQLSWPSDSDP